MQLRRFFPVLVALGCLVLEAASGAAWARNEACRVAVPVEQGCCGAPAGEPARAPGCPGGECCRIAPAMPLEAAQASRVAPPSLLATVAEAPVVEVAALEPVPASDAPVRATGGPPLFLRHRALLN